MKQESKYYGPTVDEIEEWLGTLHVQIWGPEASMFSKGGRRRAAIWMQKQLVSLSQYMTDKRHADR